MSSRTALVVYLFKYWMVKRDKQIEEDKEINLINRLTNIGSERDREIDWETNTSIQRVVRINTNRETERVKFI